ncbi:MAG: 4-amino-4-deoxy-L-arabinose-phospho-UDP flippase [Methylococcaceae bacterium]|nr:4-amino-4-deoxy-L-arabinose-phospho-UDP flippase [Methylococcaceae bacterium]
MLVYVVALICVIGLAIGQILFKIGAVSLAETGSFFALQTFIKLVAALCLYGIMSIAWIWVLQKVELGKVYPLMALAFVLVPIGSHFIFGERFQPQYFAGITLIILGILITVRA